METIKLVLSNPVTRYAFRSACKFRQIDFKEQTIAGKRVGKYHFNATLNMIARIVNEGHQ